VAINEQPVELENTPLSPEKRQHHERQMETISADEQEVRF
jgi:hypothetical protein